MGFDGVEEVDVLSEFVDGGQNGFEGLIGCCELGTCEGVEFVFICGDEFLGGGFGVLHVLDEFGVV